MTPLTLVAAALVIGLLISAFAFWTPIFAVPLTILFLIGLGIAEMARRRNAGSGVRDLRKQQPGADEVDFTERDQETLYQRH